MPTGRPDAAMPSRAEASVAAKASKPPCEKFSRRTRTPSAIKRVTTPGSAVDGPSVASTLVRTRSLTRIVSLRIRE